MDDSIRRKTRESKNYDLSKVRQAEFYTGSRDSSFAFLICMATYVSPYVAIVPCVCVRLFMCHAPLHWFFFNILFSNIIFYVNMFYVSDF
jgi:hypothetical protein